MEDYLAFPRMIKRGKHQRVSVHVDGDEDVVTLGSKASRQSNVTEQEVVKHEACLPYLQYTLFACTMEDTLAQLRILAECNNELRILKTIADREMMLATKYSVVVPPVTDELAGIDVTQLDCDRYKLDKLAADRKFCIDVMASLYLDLALRGCFEPITETNKTINGLEEYRQFLVEDEAKNKVLRRELIKQVRQQRNHIKTVTYDTDVVIEGMKRQLEDYSMIAETRSRYTGGWERARTEQNIQYITDTEKGPTEVIQYYRQRYDHETRVHSEIILLTQIFTNETLTKIDDWMEKYDKDMEQLDIKIQLKKNQYQAQRDTRIEKEEMLAQHDKEMVDWIDFKDKREKARLYHLKMTTAAIAVQAWWRGLLVRLQLGPYRKGKKGKK